MATPPFDDRPPETARVNAYDDSHLARARWMTEHGYRHLLDPRMQ
jgi:hypothetical protein